MRWPPLLLSTTLAALPVAAAVAAPPDRLDYVAAAPAGQRLHFEVDERMARLHGPAGEPWLWLDLGSGRLQVLALPEGGGATQPAAGPLDPPQLEQRVREAARALQAALDAAAPADRQRTQARLADLLQARGAWQALEQTGPGDRQRPTGRREHVAGLACDVVALYAGDAHVAEACTVPAQAVPGGTGVVALLNALDRLTLQLRDAAAGSPLPPPAAHPLAVAARGGALPLRVRLVSGDGLQASWERVAR